MKKNIRLLLFFTMMISFIGCVEEEDIDAVPQDKIVQEFINAGFKLDDKTNQTINMKRRTFKNVEEAREFLKEVKKEFNDCDALVVFPRIRTRIESGSGGSGSGESTEEESGKDQNVTVDISPSIKWVAEQKVKFTYIYEKREYKLKDGTIKYVYDGVKLGFNIEHSVYDVTQESSTVSKFKIDVSYILGVELYDLPLNYTVNRSYQWTLDFPDKDWNCEQIKDEEINPK